jgi:signal transduction histidine kinase/HAMP domain-containing protein
MSRNWLRLLDGLRARLGVVILLAAAPLLIVVGVGLVNNWRSARAQAERELLAQARLAAGGYQLKLAEAQRLLAVVATLSPIQQAAQGGDVAACTKRLAELNVIFPETIGFGVWDLSGNAVCTDDPLSAPINASDRLWFQQAKASQTFSVGDFQLTRPTGEPALAFGYPLFGTDGQLVAIVSTGFRLTSLSNTPATAVLPADTILTILDDDGVILARSQEAEAWIGKLWPNTPPFDAVVDPLATIAQATGLDGHRRVFAFATVTGPGETPVHLTLSKPAQSVYGSANRALATSLLSALGLGLLGVVTAQQFSRQALFKPLQALQTATRRLSAGEWQVRIASDQFAGELGQLAAAFNRMAGELQQREAEREAALRREQAARQTVEQTAERLQRLQAVTEALSQPLTPEQVVVVIVEQGVSAMGAAAGLVQLVADDGETLELVGQMGYPKSYQPFWRVPLSTPLPATEVVQTGQPMWLESHQAFTQRYPHLRDVRAPAYEAVAMLPLTLAKRTFGILAFSFVDPQRFDEPGQEFALTLARQCAQALDRANAYADLEARVRQRTAALEEASARLTAEMAERQRIQRQLEHWREAERKRIARELHDQIGGALTGLKMELSRLRRRHPDVPPELVGGLEALAGEVDGTVALVRRIASELRPPLLDDFGLVDALQQLVDEFTRRSGIAGRLVNEVDYLPLPPDTAVATYRICQEALTNVMRHAQATAVEVTVETTDNAFLLRITDNGRGMDLAAQPGSDSLGLRGMRERAALIAGTLDIVSAPGQGTTVLLRGPVDLPPG